MSEAMSEGSGVEPGGLFVLNCNSGVSQESTKGTNQCRMHFQQQNHSSMHKKQLECENIVESLGDMFIQSPVSNAKNFSWNSNLSTCIQSYRLA